MRVTLRYCTMGRGLVTLRMHSSTGSMAVGEMMTMIWREEDGEITETSRRRGQQEKRVGVNYSNNFASKPTDKTYQ